ncbi:MAG: polysaccharide deacetylase family protein [Calditrichaeota bacterium]|nr:MAG: polysaccharide deacetylase family protein [Calditrichota bacterium]
MRSKLKHFLYSGLEWGHINDIARHRRKKALLIITYHSVLPPSEKFRNFDYRNCVTTDSFAAQLRYLKKKYRVISLKEAEERLQNHDLHGYECVITFDDGFLNNRRYAMPILQSLGLSAVFYVTSAFIGTEEMLWTEKVNAILMNAQTEGVTVQLDEPVYYSLQNTKKREEASVHLRTWLKYQPVREQERVVRALIEATGYTPRLVDSDPERYAFMTWDDVRVMRDAGMEIGSHTAHHYLLNMLTEKESYYELKESRETIEKELDQACTFFSYPNGAVGNFLPVHFKQLAELGYTNAVTQVPGVNKPEDNIYALNRVNISAGMDMSVFKAYCSGAYKLLT